MNALLSFQAISKSFGGVPVLNRVSFEVGAGRTVGLVGENGAGKSTLMNILGGNVRADAGRMVFDGCPHAPAGPAEAAAAGIAFIHQELNLFSNLTIAENLFLTRFPTTIGIPWIRRRALRRRSAEWLAEVGLAASPDTPVERLSAGERQLVEIAKALSQQPRLLILDEPTTSLSAREAERLFALMGRLRARGLAMVYISHHLGEVLRLCDEVRVLRDGALVGSGPCVEFDADRLITLMIGRSLSQLFPARPAASVPDVMEAPALEVAGLTEPGQVRNITFTVRRREIVGLAGLMGAGRSELARLLFGLDPAQGGRVRVAGTDVTRASVRRRIRHGMAFLTEDRREDGLCLEASIADNLALVALRRHARPPFGALRGSALRASARRFRAAVRLTPSARDDQPVQTLSGGNQQKVVLAKWLLAEPTAMILDEPTRGIDVGAKSEIYELIHQLAEGGAGVLLVSSELEELLGLCDRILVLRRGEIVDEMARAAFDRERILRAALHEAAAA
jgi:ribose transport system ATP-binding protein